MGVFRHPIEVGSPDGSRFERVQALVDTGATYTTIPRSVLERLGVSHHRRRRFLVAEGQMVDMDVGHAWVRVDGESTITLVGFGAEASVPVLGATTLQLLSLAVEPVHERLVPAENYLLALAYSPPRRQPGGHQGEHLPR